MEQTQKHTYNVGLGKTIRYLGFKGEGILNINGLDAAIIVISHKEVKGAIALNSSRYNSNSGDCSMPTIVKQKVASHGRRCLEWYIYYSIEYSDASFYYLNYLGAIPLFDNSDGAVLDNYYIPKTRYRNAYESL